MLDFATDLGRRAGALLRDGLDHRRTIELKGAFDLVTDMDRASEDLIVSAIAAEFPARPRDLGRGERRDRRRRVYLADRPA
jgi:fructose-1,6-bisphosphatase/inositol monophosphatase family enzyme